MEKTNPITVRVTESEIEQLRERLDPANTYGRHSMSPGRVIRSFLWQELSKPFKPGKE